MEYTKNPDPGRYGELLCLLTPIYEVSLEVTEQLRLEQYVNEGEARIDALLLMSMINDIDYEMPLEASINWLHFITFFSCVIVGLTSIGIVIMYVVLPCLWQ